MRMARWGGVAKPPGKRGHSDSAAGRWSGAGARFRLGRNNQAFPFMLRGLPTEALTLAKTLFSLVVKHGVSQHPIRFGLVTAAIGFEPCDDVGIQAHRNGLLRCPI